MRGVPNHKILISGAFLSQGPHFPKNIILCTERLIISYFSMLLAQSYSHQMDACINLLLPLGSPRVQWLWPEGRSSRHHTRETEGSEGISSTTWQLCRWRSHRWHGEPGWAKQCPCVCEVASGYMESWPVCIHACVYYGYQGLPCYAITVAFVWFYIVAYVIFTCIACARLRGYTIGTGCNTSDKGSHLLLQ